MKSFRRDQFHAVFEGLAIADALTQGPPAFRGWGQRGAAPTAALPPCRDWLSGFRASFAAMVEPACNGAAGARGAARLTLPPGEWGAIASLPILLRYLDAPTQGLALLAPHLDDTAQTTAAILMSSLHSGVSPAAAIAAPPTPALGSPDGAETAIALALHCTLAAQGSVEVALRLGLRWAARSPSIPLLVGILAASATGLSGIPTHWRWAIAHHPAIAPWHQTRWQLLPDVNLDVNLTMAATQLWQQWAGHHRQELKPPGPLFIGVSPISSPAA